MNIFYAFEPQKEDFVMDLFSQGTRLHASMNSLLELDDKQQKVLLLV